MLKNYLTIALRTLWKHRGYAAISVTSLAVGLACCFLITLYVGHELSFDRFHDDADRIYRVTREYTRPTQTSTNANIAAAVGPTLAATYPAVEQTVRFMLPFPNEVLITHEDQRFYEVRFYWADSTVFDVFDFSLARGNPATALAQPFTVVLTETAARKYFGDQDPIGQVLTIQGWRSNEYTVTGILDPVPANSHLQFDFLASLAGETTLYTSLFDGEGQWTNSLFYTYVRLTDPASAASINDLLPAFADEHLGAFGRSRGFVPNFQLQPLVDVHLRSDHSIDVANAGDIRYVYLFSAIALFILLLACANFMNLATARSARRAKEVGLRKVLGAHRRQLIRQFLGEAVVLALVAVLVAFLLVELALPAFTQLSGQPLSTPPGSSGLLLTAFLGIGLLTGVLAGSYPAFFLSAFRPVRALKGQANGQSGAARLRKGLVVFQFSISVLLIVSTLVVYNQLTYMTEADLGFEADQVVTIPIRSEVRQNLNIEALKQDLMQSPGIVQVSASAGVPGNQGLIDNWSVVPEGAQQSEQVGMTIAGVDVDFIEVLGLEVVAGRGFSDAFATDATEAFVLNETAARVLGWDDPIGKQLTTVMNDGRTGTVIGVVKDFHLNSLRESIDPIVFQIWPDRFTMLSLKLRTTDLTETLAFLEERWSALVPEQPLEYAFLDVDFANQYQAEARLGRLFGVFTGLALFIACLGLFGLAAFTAEQRTKEIGVRKVLGATVPGLVLLLSKDFTRLVLIATVIAVPPAYLALDRWLIGFAYRIDLGPGVFLLAGGAALAIALLTVSYQAVKTSLLNPVKVLRYE